MRIIIGIMLVALVAGCGGQKAQTNPFESTQLLITYKSEPSVVMTYSINDTFHETGHADPQSGFDQRVRCKVDGGAVDISLISGDKVYSAKQFTTLSPSQLLFDAPQIKIEVKPQE